MALEALDPKLPINPSQRQVEAFLHLHVSDGFCFVNLHEYHEIAQYPKGTLSGPGVSGRAAYHRYLERVRSLLSQIPGARILTIPCELVMIGTGHWHELVIGYYPSRDCALRLNTLPGYEEVVPHREAALKAVLTLTVKGDMRTLCAAP
ncbi:MAG: hypothetical protein ABW034_23335 [Steroidobacteraceae bacterium]